MPNAPAISSSLSRKQQHVPQFKSLHSRIPGMKNTAYRMHKNSQLYGKRRDETSFGLSYLEVDNNLA
jgi:hypothetical protein